ncbi:MAG: dipeptidase [Bacillota bacterium]|nr:dipeptidase [Bacillota bacterium]
MHARPMVADAHCDFLFNMAQGLQSITDEPGPDKHITLRSLEEGRVGLQFFAVWLDEKSGDHPLEKALESVNCFYRMLEQSQGRIYLMDRKKPPCAAWDGRTAAVLVLEGGSCLLGSKDILDIFYRLGVRVISLTWNQKNALACGAAVKKDTGLTPEGKEILMEMDRLNIALDVSHLSRKSFWDALEVYRRPVIASHSNACGVFEHPRNLDDAQIKAVISSKGFIGVNYFPGFLGEKDVSAADICRHIDHIVSMGGQDCVGLGSDFDGIKTMPEGISGPADVYKIAKGLAKMGYPEERIMKITYGNLINYIIKFL